MIISLAIAAMAIAGLMLLLPTGRTAALTAPAPDSLTDSELYIKFEGAVEDRPIGTLLVSGDWRIGGITVTVDLSTTLDDEHGPPVLGAWVEVEGWQRDDGSVLATEIKTKRGPGEEEEFEFKGIIEELPVTPGYTGTLLVSSIRFAVDLSTTIEGTPANSVVAEIEDRDDDEAEREWKGFIERLGNGPIPRYEDEWVVGDISFTVVSTTFIDMSEGTPAIGRRAEVRGSGSDNQWIAFEIEIDSFGDNDNDDGLALQSKSSIAASESGVNGFNVSNTSGHSRMPDLVVRASGDHHLIWEESDGWIYHSRKVEGNPWSLPMPISTSSRANLKGVDGALYLVWSDDDGSLNYEIYLAQWDDAS